MNTQPESRSDVEALRLADWLLDNVQHINHAEAAAELRRLHQHEVAHTEWLDKTEWVQDTAHYSELGMHRADVIKQRFDRLRALNKELLEALKHAASCVQDNYCPDMMGHDWDDVIAKAKANHG